MSVASPLEQAMLTLINQERAAAGVAPLKFDNNLNDAAEEHSASMLVNNIFSHTGADGSTARERMVDAGYVFSGTNASGENIAYQSERGAPGAQDDVQDLHDGLMRSPGHRANILNPNFEEIGIGIEEGLFTDGGATFSAVMVTQNFALTQAVDVPGAPTPTTPTDTPTAPVDQPQANDDDTPTAPPQPQTPVAETDDGVTPPAKPVPEITDSVDEGDKTPVQPVSDDDDDVLVVEVPAEDTDSPAAEEDSPSEGDAPTGEGEVPEEEDDTPILPIVVTDLDTGSDTPEMDAPSDGSPTSEDGTDGEAQDGSDDGEGDSEDDGEDDGPKAPAEGDAKTPVAEDDGSSGEDGMPGDEEDDAPAMEDEAPQPDDDDEFDFTDGAPTDDEGGEAGSDAPVWVKTHDDDTYAKVITDFTADCNADAFAALDTELQLFVLREFECNFDLG